MVEAYCDEAMFGHLTCDMCTMTNVRVKSVEHDDHCSWILLGLIAIVDELDEIPFFTFHDEPHEVYFWKDMIFLRV